MILFDFKVNSWYYVDEKIKKRMLNYMRNAIIALDGGGTNLRMVVVDAETLQEKRKQ